MGLTKSVAVLLHSAIMLGLPFVVGMKAGTLAARRRATRWAHHAGYCLAALVVASFLSYVGIYFAMDLWIEDARPGDFAIRFDELVAGFAYYGWVNAIITGPTTFGGYFVGYFRASDRESPPKGDMVFPTPPAEERPTG